MNLLKELTLEKTNLFQFYIIVGDNKKNKEIIVNFFKEELNLTINNFFFKTGEDFKIDEARKIKQENSYSNYSEEKSKKIILLDFQKVNIETQNALLKTFEEVGENTHFFLFVPSEEFILATIKSRGRIIFGEKEYDLELAEKFLKADFKTREKMIEKIDKSNIAVFMNSLEMLILKDNKINQEFYKHFLELKQYIFDKGVSLKNILIWIAINL